MYWCGTGANTVGRRRRRSGRIIETKSQQPRTKSRVSKSFAISIVRTLRDRGHQAYLVGGCVRDLLLGREPADYDVATDALPDEVMRIFPETYAVGAQFGVVLVPVPELPNNSVIPSEARVSQSEGLEQSRDLVFAGSATKSRTRRGRHLPVRHWL